MSATLIAHRGAVQVSRDELMVIPAPKPTATWFPVPHGEVVSAVETRLNESGFDVKRANYAVGRDGARMFATLDLVSHVAPGVSLAVGIRNSNDQSFPIGWACGNRVFVCDNLSFSAETVISRKHTRYGNLRFTEALSVAVRRLSDYQANESIRVNLMQSHELTNESADALILNAFEHDIVNSRSLPAVIKEWRTPRHAEFQPRTVWSLMNAFTEAMKPMMARPGAYSAATIKLQSLLCRDARYRLTV